MWLHLIVLLVTQCSSRAAVRNNPLLTLTNSLTTNTERGWRGEVVHITCRPGNKVTTLSVSPSSILISLSFLPSSPFSPSWLEVLAGPGGDVRASLTRGWWWSRESVRAGRSATSPSPTISYTQRLSCVPGETGEFRPWFTPETDRVVLFTGNIWRSNTSVDLLASGRGLCAETTLTLSPALRRTRDSSSSPPPSSVSTRTATTSTARASSTPALTRRRSWPSAARPQ